MIITDRRRWPNIESDLDHHVTNQGLDQRPVEKNSNSRRLPQSESPVVEGANTAYHLCWELLTVEGGPPEIFQQESPSMIWIHILFSARIQSSRGLTLW